MLKLTRRQELALVDLGLEIVLNKFLPKPKKVKKNKKTGRKWSKAQKAKFINTMKKKWADKHK